MSAEDISQGTKEFSTENLTQINETSAEANGKDELCKTEENEQRHYFGIGSWHPKCLQVFASKKFFTFMLCVFGLVEGALISGFEPIVVSTIERRYRFSSTLASLIIIVFDISVVISVVFISYFGDKANKPRWVGIAFFLQGVGAFIFAVPHFAFGSYDVGSVEINNGSLESCNAPLPYIEDCDLGNIGAYVLLLVANVIIGIGAAPLFTIGLSFIDDIVHPRWVPLHIGFFQVSNILGPGIGFGIGSGILNLYVDVGQQTNLTPSDPTWVGAWWLNFILVAIVSVLGSIPFFLYPRQLADSHLVYEFRQKQMKGDYKQRFEDESSFCQQIKAFPFHLWSLLKNPTWLLTSVGIATLFISLDGLVSFAPKYIESVYRVTPSTAGLIIGALGIFSGTFGTLVGALLSQCVKIGKNIGILIWLTLFLSLFPLAGFFLDCPNVEVTGIATPYANNTLMEAEVLVASCNVDCNCNSTIFEPVCGADGRNYFSPCRASCDKVGNNTNFSFENCNCIANNLINDMVMRGEPIDDYQTVLMNSTATRGLCPDSCTFLIPFIALVAIFVFFVFLVRVPFTLVTLRAIAEEQRSFSLGVQSVIFRVFGSIPGPLLFGVLIDSGCVRAQYECGRLANCWIYDNNLLSTRAFIFCVVGVATCVVCTFISWLCYPPIGCKGTPHEEMFVEKKEKISTKLEEKIEAVNPVYDKTEAEIY